MAGGVRGRKSGRSAARAAVRAAIVGIAAIGATACSAVSEPELAEIRSAVSYRADGPTSVSLVTAKGKGAAAGGVHSALVVTASERVVFDPSGSFIAPDTRRIGDVVFGVTPQVLAAFELYQADRDHVAVVQTIALSAVEAEAVLARAVGFGGVGPGFCAVSVGEVARAAPSLGHVGDSFWPSDLMADFAATPGVVTRIVTDTDLFEPEKE